MFRILPPKRMCFLYCEEESHVVRVSSFGEFTNRFTFTFRAGVLGTLWTMKHPHSGVNESEKKDS